MAILKDIQQPSGVTVKVWRIIGLNMNLEEHYDDGEWQFSGKARIVLAGYATTTWREDGVKPLTTISRNLDTATFGQMVAENAGIYDSIQNILENHLIAETLGETEGGEPIPGPLYGGTTT